MNKKWIVFWFKGNRIGSVENTESNWKQIKELFHYNIIQTDITGTIHLNVLSLTNKQIERS
jgi:hypothetical protein